jgi:hypothetical protein
MVKHRNLWGFKWNDTDIAMKHLNTSSFKNFRKSADKISKKKFDLIFWKLKPKDRRLILRYDVTKDKGERRSK